MTTVLPSPRAIPPTEQPARTPVRRWQHHAMRHLPTMLVGVLLLLTAAVRLINLTGAPQRIDDEGTYVAQAYALLHYGELSHYTYWYDHPPLGWLQIAGWFLLTGGPDAASTAVASGRGFMVIVAVITAALLWTLARRLGLSLAAAATAVAVFAMSPLAVELGRTVYLDNIATAWLLAALVLFCSPQQRLSAAFGGAACFGVAVLTKETMLLLLPAVLMLAWTRAARATRRYAAAVVVTVLGLMLTGYLLMAAVRSELIPGPGHVSLIDAVQFQLYGRDSGGSVFDTASLNRTTFERWWVLDPVLLTAALPAAAAALAVRRLQPIATGIVLLSVILVRDGYLPAPFVIAALPLVALLVAGVPDAALGWARENRTGRYPLRRIMLVGTLTAMTALGMSAGIVWTPVLRHLLTVDADAPLLRAQEWITTNVPTEDRLIVDDAIWVDLVAEGRDRRDVVWFYKLDTDAEVQGWSRRGWRDYDWVVSTPSMRAGTAPTGQLADAVAGSTPVAVFGAGDGRVELRRINPPGAASPALGAGTPTASAGELLADRLDNSAAPALTILRSGRADPRLLTTLGILTAREPVSLSDLPAMPGEDAAGMPRRQLHLATDGAEQGRITAFFQAQSGQYAPDVVEPVPGGLLVRFPAAAPTVTLPGADAAVEAGPSARLRVADLRRTGVPEVVEVLGVDGRPVGSLGTGGYATPAGYRSLPPGSYILATRPAADPASPSVARQVVQVLPDRSYTFALFIAADGTSVNAQFVPDDPPVAPRGFGQVRLVEGARDPGVVTLAVDDPGGPKAVLADGVSYGLVTGYAQVRAGERTLWLQSGDREWRLTTRVPSTTAVTLLLTDTPQGPVVHAIPDAPRSAPELGRSDRAEAA
ncbi:glycosyltransferase family 39 protein [Pseudonocardia charpentierae]|uniref:Glycosyltransferase family 39 protein n=1 Tax=Pseudonocardia charpentierae TaxID=3075545 RepID=A0ABU2NAX3_9PSEU|nr:glycosyltransferase family 39 protein [Pseudonocardia sp. DSM 45834]MDT0351107.1 glycosyltransferase family 39 protein [Pseudonocardia sp. DSM 45834]